MKRSMLFELHLATSCCRCISVHAMHQRHVPLGHSRHVVCSTAFAVLLASTNRHCRLVAGDSYSPSRLSKYARYLIDAKQQGEGKDEEEDRDCLAR